MAASNSDSMSTSPIPRSAGKLQAACARQPARPRANKSFAEIDSPPRCTTLALSASACVQSRPVRRARSTAFIVRAPAIRC
ncbi:hypothetical protein [Lysobacter enzymogenes]|uniref:hypothetical protein n=1 Tax=Lysobacter enzymogenes TaxID=69 RepID=UPI0015867AFC|nr:hypothetical protein [Lysobacter enzymogenes]QQQ02182.1 hypothetical protein JHW41_04120 [Lysobacter enzymogenes]